MEPIRFEATIRWWDPEKAAGLAVCEVPAEHVAALGGLRQQRVRGRIGGEEFGSSVMPAGGGVGEPACSLWFFLAESRSSMHQEHPVKS